MRIFLLLLSAGCYVFCAIPLIASIGSSGNGKSTIIQTCFGVANATVGAYFSATNATLLHTCGNSSAVPKCNIIDTVGTKGTDGAKPEDIMADIEHFLLQYKNLRVNQVRAFVLMIVLKTRVGLKNTLQPYLQAFSPSLVKSLVIVVNNKAHDKLNFSQFLLQAEKEAKEYLQENGYSFSIPIVGMNATNPSALDKASLFYAIKKVKPYKLKDLAVKKQRVQQLFNAELSNSSNYITKVYKNETSMDVLEMQLVVVPQIKQIPETKYIIEEHGTPPITKTKKIKRYTILKDMVVNELVQRSVRTTKPFIVERSVCELQYEESYYWDIAFAKYKQEIASSKKT